MKKNRNKINAISKRIGKGNRNETARENRTARKRISRSRLCRRFLSGQIRARRWRRDARLVFVRWRGARFSLLSSRRCFARSFGVCSRRSALARCATRRRANLAGNRRSSARPDVCGLKTENGRG